MFHGYLRKENMIYINTSNAEQLIRYIPRKYEADLVLLTDETSDKTHAISSTFAIEGYYSRFGLTLSDLKEGDNYNITVVNNASDTFKASIAASNNLLEINKPITQIIKDESLEVVYRDKIFVTDQEDYSINNNSYTQRDSDNEYLTA